MVGEESWILVLEMSLIVEMKKPYISENTYGYSQRIFFLQNEYEL